MWNAFQITFHFIRCILLYTLGLNKSSDAFLAGKSMLGSMSFRLEASAAKDLFIGFRVIWRVVKQLLHASAPNIEYNANCIFDGKASSSQLRRNYVEWQGGVQASFVSRDTLLFMPEKWAWLAVLIALLPLLPFYCLATLCLPSRANVALLLTEYIELVNLSMLLQKGGVQRLFFFSPYEKDANCMALYLMQKGVFVSKHPSPGPLMTHNSILIADSLVLSSEYQREEMKGSSLFIRVKKTEKWFPEFSRKYMHLYANKQLVTPSLTVGFYSHASWLRKKKNHSDDGLNILAAETFLLNELALFLKKHNTTQLIVFLHPREKQAHALEESRAYYETIFSGLNYSFASFEKSTDSTFASVDVAVAAFSTIVYERLFAGFKTLIASYGIPGFPINDSGLYNITINNPGQLDVKLNMALNCNTAFFFESNQLFGYRYFEYPLWEQLIC